jgi:VIT1/CCC1 family predicted Fe2+/Mn2+ transporter
LEFLIWGNKDAQMKESVKKGFGFGLTSGVITTLGMMVGLSASTGSRTAVIGGIIAIAIADAFSDAVGIHISEEAENHHSTLFSKFLFALTFVVPVLVFQLSMAIFVSVCWGVSLVIIFSWHLAKLQGSKTYTVILEHVAIVGLVILITHFVGRWIATLY